MNSFYYFPPWRKQLYFSEELFPLNESASLIYHPYILISKGAWYLWKRSRLFRKLFTINRAQLPALFHEIIKNLSLEGWYFQINVGTKGIEQKMTVMAYSKEGKTLFIKAGTSLPAKDLIANEVEKLRKISSHLTTPKVLKSIESNKLSILVTELIPAKKVAFTKLNELTFKYLLEIGKTDYFQKDKIFFCLAQGDFCPWNLLMKESDELIVIDWEHSDYHPIGYDLLTFIFQTNFLINPYQKPSDILEANTRWITRYFLQWGVENFNNYLRLFVQIKINNELQKGKTTLLGKWRSLMNYLDQKV